MPNENMTCETPRYVLHEDREPIGPEISKASSHPDSLAIYGFSGKHTYDRFVANCDRDLRPYPLMKGYLRNRIAEGEGGTYLVVIDAITPTDEQLTVATMKDVLTAQIGGQASLKGGFHMAICPETKEYALNEMAT